MKKLESDLIIIGLIRELLKRTKLKIENIVEGYDNETVEKLVDSTKLLNSPDDTEKLVKLLANQVYKRITKKVT